MVSCRCCMQDVRGREARVKHGVHCPWGQQLTPQAQCWRGCIHGEANTLASEEGGGGHSVASTVLRGWGSTHATRATTAFGWVLTTVEEPAHFRLRQERQVWCRWGTTRGRLRLRASAVRAVQQASYFCIGQHSAAGGLGRERGREGRDHLSQTPRLGLILLLWGPWAPDMATSAIRPGSPLGSLFRPEPAHHIRCPAVGAHLRLGGARAARPLLLARHRE